ncbi:MAG: citrate lyase holo-[acyl-carrier protein] synthase [Candidatus Accumulibacter sp.]|jgi:holo-ACP synthase CitX|nr:citrate lyase holo-[acyl-carrier protein] synthase [Accumulibacter sp.]
MLQRWREILDARDARQTTLTRALNAGCPATLFVSLNIPGREKTPPGAEALFSWMSQQIETRFPVATRLASFSDALGPCRILGLADDPVAVKRQCVELESEHPSSRLIDLDIYTPTGTQIDRASLGLAARSCLLCERRAVDCIRAGHHGFDEVIARANELLAPFRT